MWTGVYRAFRSYPCESYAEEICPWRACIDPDGVLRECPTEGCGSQCRSKQEWNG